MRAGAPGAEAEGLEGDRPVRQQRSDHPGQVSQSKKSQFAPQDQLTPIFNY